MGTKVSLYTLEHMGKGENVHVELLYEERVSEDNRLRNQGRDVHHACYQAFRPFR